jgi:hypothetical protein
MQSAVRKVLLRVMQTDAKDVKFLKPVDDGAFVIPDVETDDGVILRPNFEKSWLDNAPWHDNTVKFIRRKASLYTPAFTEQMMEEKTDADILERMASIFKGWAGAYSKQKRRAAAGSTDDPTNRRKGRKIRVRMTLCCCSFCIHHSYRNAFNGKRFVMLSRWRGQSGTFSFSRRTSPLTRRMMGTIWILIAREMMLISKLKRKPGYPEPHTIVQKRSVEPFSLFCKRLKFR